MKYIKIGDICIASRRTSGYLLTVAPDTASGDVDRNTVSYHGCDGEEIKDVYYKSREFMIEGYIMSDSALGYSKLRRRLIQTLTPKTSYTLVYHDGFNTYKAEAYISGNITFGRVVNGKYGAFIINVIIPSFYFKSFKETTKGVYQRVDKVTGSFSLPKVFTERTYEAEVINKGDVSAFPIFSLRCVEEMSNNVIICNDTTGEKIQLDYKPAKGELITIDVEQFEITSSVNGNIIKYLTADSSFFMIGTGIVALSCLTNGVAVSVSYYERFSGV